MYIVTNMTYLKKRSKILADWKPLKRLEKNPALPLVHKFKNWQVLRSAEKLVVVA